MLSELNDKQREAVTATNHHILVLAGAGSGKTRVLVKRMEWLVKHEHVAPEDLFAVTFTNKAALEMKQRLELLLHLSLSHLWVGTFHGLCHRFLRHHHEMVGLSASFQILDVEEETRFIKRVILSLNLDIERWTPKQARAFIHQHKDEGIRPDKVHVSSFGPARTLHLIYETYEAMKRKADVVDFSDLLLLTYEMFRNYPALRLRYAKRFHSILVDEFQDTNEIQYALIRLLSEDGASVMAVGDDDQSIYGWRGAKVDNMHRFSVDYSPALVIRLEQNYRSTTTILNAANALIENNTSRLGKVLWTNGASGEKIQVYGACNEIDEARFVAETIANITKQNASYHEIAVLYRSNAQSRALEETFIRFGIPYQIYGGLRFFDRAEVRDALAYLRLLVNPHDDSAFLRIVNVPTRGIGGKTLEKIGQISGEKGVSLWEATGIFLKETQKKTALANFRILMESLIARQALPLAELLQVIVLESGLDALYRNKKEEIAQAKLENLKELVNAAKEFQYDERLGEGETSILSFLSHASLDTLGRGSKAMDTAVHLMTMHAAKGLEFPNVFLVGMEEGLFPGVQSFDSPERLEEERRLCYVGMTRAGKKLFLSHCHIRRQYGREEYHRPSRFLKEIPISLLKPIVAQNMQRSYASSLYSGGTTFSQKSQSEQPYAGQTVCHPKFGEGVVLQSEGSGANRRVQVRFQTEETKWLVLAYANLSF